MTEQPNEADPSPWDTPEDIAREPGLIAADGVMHLIQVHLAAIRDAIDAMPSYIVLNDAQKSQIEQVETAMLDWGLQTQRVKDAHIDVRRTLMLNAIGRK